MIQKRWNQNQLQTNSYSIMSAITILSSLAFSITAYTITEALIPRLSPTLISAGLKGRDLLKGQSTGGGGFPTNDLTASSKHAAILKSHQLDPSSTAHQNPEEYMSVSFLSYIISLQHIHRLTDHCKHTHTYTNALCNLFSNSWLDRIDPNQPVWSLVASTFLSSPSLSHYHTTPTSSQVTRLPVPLPSSAQTHHSHLPLLTSYPFHIQV